VNKLFLKVFLVAVLLLTQASFFLSEATGSEQAESNLKADTVEVGISYSGSYSSARTVPFIGYFLTDEVEVGGAFIVETGNYDSNDYTTTALSILGRYNVPIEENLYLFGEIGLEQVNVDDGSDASAFLLGVGARVFPKDNFSINFLLDYIIGSYETGNTDVDTDGFRLSVGLSVFVF
jgi:hypothetical protein